jgi:putative (di)nucleoside polyphosphate hydrolase
MPSLDDDLEDVAYRPAVGMMVLNRDNKIFMGQRLDHISSAWQMPQGGISSNETMDQAMFRELQEEIGTRDVDIIFKSKRWYRYDLPPELADRLWDGKFKGQRQIWYALRFRGKDEDINIHTQHPEFREWKWVAQEEVLDLIVPFKKELYRLVLSDLWPYISKN